MALQSDGTLFRSRDEILADEIASLQDLISDAYIGEDGVLYITLSINAGVAESVFTALQIQSDDMFIQTANDPALNRKGDEHGVDRLVGTRSTGPLTFSGNGGVVIPVGTECAYDPGTGDLLYFDTTQEGTIPNPGNPTALVATADAATGVLDGTYEYVVTFYTDGGGETLPSPDSLAVTVSSKKVDLSEIPLGGPGTAYRIIYRMQDGDTWRRLVIIPDNTTTTYLDNTSEDDAFLLINPPTISTAEQIVLTAQSDDAGVDYNVGVGTITVLTDAPDGVTGVTNVDAFTGGTESELTEDYRTRLLNYVRNPQSGSAEDLASWAEEISGVDTATVFENDNMGDPADGHTTIRISGPNGSVPDDDVIQAVFTFLRQKNIANITIHVTTFDAVPLDVDVTTTLADGYTNDDTDPAVISAIAGYINSLLAGGTWYVAGTVASVVGLPGIVDVVVNTPSSNQTPGVTEKYVAGSITVTD